MANPNIVMKKTIHVVLISFAVVFGLLVIGFQVPLDSAKTDSKKFTSRGGQFKI